MREAPRIPSKTNRKVAIPPDPVLYRERHKIEIMFGRLKDWRRLATRYDRRAHTFFSAIAIAATVIWRAWRPRSSCRCCSPRPTPCRSSIACGGRA